MKEVMCLNDGTIYMFDASSGLEAIHKMLYTLNLSCKDDKATINLRGNRMWELDHNGKIYGCLK